MTEAEIYDKLAQVKWYHAFEILPGITTPGRLPTKPKELFEHFGLPDDLSGKQVLEVGAWDGPVTFECEARGATVTALDIQDPSRTGFNIAKEILNSSATYVQGSVYDASKLIDQQFDYVFILGVFYHLKNPLLGFEELAKVLKPNGILVFEGECLRSYWEDEFGNPCPAPDVTPVATSDIPVCLFYADAFKGDHSNWFIPNFACFRQWLRAAGMEIISHGFHDVPSMPFPQQRVGGQARKAGGTRIEHGRV